MKIIVEIDAGEKTCNPCRRVVRPPTGEHAHCRLFNKYLDQGDPTHFVRADICLAAQKEADAMEAVIKCASAKQGAGLWDALARLDETRRKP